MIITTVLVGTLLSFLYIWCEKRVYGVVSWLEDLSSKILRLEFALLSRSPQTSLKRFDFIFSISVNPSQFLLLTLPMLRTFAWQEWVLMPLNMDYQGENSLWLYNTSAFAGCWFADLDNETMTLWIVNSIPANLRKRTPIHLSRILPQAVTKHCKYNQPIFF